MTQSKGEIIEKHKIHIVRSHRSLKNHHQNFYFVTLYDRYNLINY